MAHHEQGSEREERSGPGWSGSDTGGAGWDRRRCGRHRYAPAAEHMLIEGGVHLPNLPQLLHSSVSPKGRNHLSGIAVISDIVASPTPRDAARPLREVVDSFKRARQAGPMAVFSTRKPGEKTSVEELLKKVGALMEVVRKETPLVHQVSLTRRLYHHQLTPTDHQQRRDQRLGKRDSRCRSVANHGDEFKRRRGIEPRDRSAAYQLRVSSVASKAAYV